MRVRAFISVSSLVALSAITAACTEKIAGQQPLRFSVSVSSALQAAALTGRVFVIVSRQETPEPRLRAGGNNSDPLFGVDVSDLKPGTATIVDVTTLGYPLKSISEIPEGDYYVQAVVNIYTDFHRSDGHVVWAHNDQWEGQHWNRSPGNLHSAVKKVHLNPALGGTIALEVDQRIPPVQVPADTAWIKHVKVQSKLLTAFWGRPMYIGATVLLPKGYDQASPTTYPAIYIQGHFSLAAPFNFTLDDVPETPAQRAQRESDGLERSVDFGRAWAGDNFPRMVAVTFQHPTPYYDDSYAVNSANNGPYGDALTTELIPYLEQHFHLTPQPYARILTGGSTGGWEALALQVYHPDFFNGTWVFFPDPIDFRRYQLVNIYEDANAFYPGGYQNAWIVPDRPILRTPDGQPTYTMRQASQLEAVLGSHNRSGEQFAIWESTFGPVDAEGYPKALWDKRTGVIDHQVANTMRDNGYDLREYVERNWARIGPSLVGQLHFYCGDMDSWHLNLATYLFEDAMKSLKSPAPQATFAWGRPLKRHGWHGITNTALVREMADHIARSRHANNP